MGSPKKQRKKYRRPLVIWQNDLIKEQKKLLKDYGLKNKKEIWRTEGFLTNIKSQVKQLIASKTEQAEKEKNQLITRLVKFNLILPGAALEDILVLTINDVLDKRLQTIVFQKGLAKSPKQARQFIVHGHIAINEQKINIPSFLVNAELENKITFNPASDLFNDQHPERAKEKSRKEKKSKKGKMDETDIFVADEKNIKPKKEKIQIVDEIVSEETKTRETEFKQDGKAK